MRNGVVIPSAIAIQFSIAVHARPDFRVVSCTSGIGILERAMLLSPLLFLGLSVEKESLWHCQEKRSSDPPAATACCRLLLFFNLSLQTHPLAQKFHHHVAHILISIKPDMPSIPSSMLSILARDRRAHSLHLSPTRHIFASIGSAPASYFLGS